MTTTPDTNAALRERLKTMATKVHSHQFGEHDSDLLDDQALTNLAQTITDAITALTPVAPVAGETPLILQRLMDFAQSIRLCDYDATGCSAPPAEAHLITEAVALIRALTAAPSAASHETGTEGEK